MLLISAFKLPTEIFEFPPRLLFRPTLGNFVALGARWPEFFRALANSLIITTGATFLTIVISFLGGYGYSRYRSRVLTLSAFSLMALRMLPPIIISIPLFPIFHWLGLLDRHITLIILYSVFFLSLGTWLMKSFMDQIPRELDEAAFMDGASTWQVLRQVILPLSTHGIMSIATFTMIFAWKEYLFALLFTTTRAKTAPLIISEMLQSVTGVEWGAVFAAAAIQLVPILVYVTVVQNVLVEGMMVGSVKG